MRPLRALLPALALVGCAAWSTGSLDPRAAAIRDLGSRRPDVRARAARDLERGGEDAVAALLDAVRTGSEVQRYEAVRVLGRIGAPAGAASAPLMAILRDGSVSIPVALAEALAGLGAAAVPVLLEGARDADETVRYWSVHALGAMTPVPEAALAALTDALSDPADAVRGRAAIGLVRAGGPAVPMLLRLLLGEDLDRSTASAELLERIGTPAALAALRDRAGDDAGATEAPPPAADEADLQP